MKKQKLGDWPVALRVLDREEADRFKHDPAPSPSADDAARHRKQLAAERKKPHPASRAFEQDDEDDPSAADYGEPT